MSTEARMKALLKLMSVGGYGPAKTRQLMTRLDDSDSSLEFLPEYEPADLVALGLDHHQAREFIKSDPEEVVDKLLESEIHLMTFQDQQALTKLSHGRVSPWFFVHGDLTQIDAKTVGFSGSRDASQDAVVAAEQIAIAAVRRGWSTVSGGARGIDLAAHHATVRHGGTTVVVLPQGILTWRVPDELMSGQLIVMSEFYPLDGWSSFRAMQRNKSIVHLSDRLIIPQAGIKGGTMNAAEYALKVDHPTWVLDMGADYEGNRAIARRGAQVLTWNGDLTDLDSIFESDPVPQYGQQRLI